MEAYTLSLTLRLPDCMNVKDFLACNLNPVVVLTDFRKSLKKVALETPPATPVTSPTPGDSAASEALSPAQSEAPEAPATPRRISSPSPPSPRQTKATKRKRASWDPSAEYEVERIVGYHRDKRCKMWYFVKWKNWSSEHNTFEPIENLTGCNYELMKYFEMCEPTGEELRRKNAEVKEGLRKREIYKALTAEGCTGGLKEEFSRQCLDLRELFETSDLDGLDRTMRREYGYIIRCLVGMYGHQDPGLMRRAQNYKLFLKLVKARRRQLLMNAAAEKEINRLEQTLVTIENKVDLEVFPEVRYLLELRPGSGVVVPKDPLLGCECPEGCSPKSRCCGKMGDSTFAYGPNGRLRTSSRIAIYECNSRCRCPPTCPNRVVQRGRQVKLCIFKTKTCGWGVKALEKIPKGTFVCQYTGEIIPDSVAVVRDIQYHAEKRVGYLFDLDFFAEAQLDMYCIDATEEGNVARFINHSCDPNLVVYPVWIDRLEPNLHLLAFFAKRTIQKGEEIHFDYENREETPNRRADDNPNADPDQRHVRVVSNLRCKCNSAKCRQWVFGSR